jgi:hypothetical protein
MAERRALIEGLKDLDENLNPDLAEQFLSGEKPGPVTKTSVSPPKARKAVKMEPPAQPPLPASITDAVQVSAPSPLTGVGRVPVGARVRTELAAALKRASLQRQLQGIQPNSVQDILEESLELWLLKHGHLI